MACCGVHSLDKVADVLFIHQMDAWQFGSLTLTFLIASRSRDWGRADDTSYLVTVCLEVSRRTLTVVVRSYVVEN